MRPSPYECRRGLTRTDLLVIVVLLLTGLGLFLAALPRMHQDSDRVQCAFNLKQIGEAVYGFYGQTKTLPAARIDDGYATWAVQIAPHLFQKQPGPLQKWDMQKPYASQSAEVRETQVSIYYCPARRHPPQNSIAGDTGPDGNLLPGALGDYACAAGDGAKAHPWDSEAANGPIIIGEVLPPREPGRVLHWRSRTSLDDLANGKSNTILIGDKHVPLGRFGHAVVGDGSLYNGANPASYSRVGGPGFGLAKAPDAEFNRNFGSYHKGGLCNFLMADNSVRPILPDIDDAVLGRLVNRFPAEKKP
jgi:prepilin-type processing-associated H-X9-DG protein